MRTSLTARLLAVLVACALPLAAMLFLFCAEDTPDRCGDGQPLNRYTQFCHNGQTVDKCDGNVFNPDTGFCDVSTNTVLRLCGNKTYVSSTQFCVGNTVLQKCGGSEYNPAEEFCGNETVYPKCNGQVYSPPNNPCDMRSLSIIANPPNWGVVSRDPDMQNYHVGATVSLTAVPLSDEYEFVKWRWLTDAAEEIDADNESIEFTINKAMYLAADFRVKPRATLTVSANQSDLGSVTVSPDTGGRVYALGTEITVTATANEPEYKFDIWTGAPESVNAKSESITFAITGSTTLTAYFGESGSTTDVYTLEVVASPTEGGTVSRSEPDRETYDAGTSVTVTAAPFQDQNWRFVKWTNESDQVVSENERHTFPIYNNTTLTAIFEQEAPPVRHTITINIDPPDGGEVSLGKPQPDNGYPHLEEIKVMASAFKGYRFIGWEGAGTDVITLPTLEFKIAENMTLTAKFKRDKETFLDGRDNTVYEQVTIGTQIWMAENLNYAGIDGDVGVCYDNDDSNCVKYGRLYRWVEAMDIAQSFETTSWTGSDSTHQGICPNGWRIPTNADWDILVNTVGGVDGWMMMANKLKSQTGWNPYSGISSTDESGFSALPGGGHWSETSERPAGFDQVGDNGHWWSATKSNDNAAANAMRRTMSHTTDNVSPQQNGKYDSFSVRCVRDK